ncbi:hypothetical protein [Psychromarinibacter halotolerans]|uniref:Uncharacterized protein n=1 Tax=Psychromarinibacter halotolerans TaxID=1775175 RepID=A0ABV7GYA0_9RHOB|nr:hypothetical protein [Psychromarinibacter halotolerans]MDF0598445.1 hypothetical protein [Psychromarinibacter halotolerans]
MPTTNISSIRASGGGDYTTIAAWEAATDNDLVSADVVEIGRIDEAANYNESVTIAGATTDATRYRKLTVADGIWHEGVPDVTGIAHMKGNPSGRFIVIDESNFWIERLMMSHDGQSVDTSDECIRCQPGGRTGILISRCIFEGSAVADTDAIYFNTSTSAAANSASIDNCLAFGFGRGGLTIQFYNGASSSPWTLNVDHCTLNDFDNDSGGEGGGFQFHSYAAGTVNCPITFYNTTSTDPNTHADYGYDRTDTSGSATFSGSHNASSDTSLSTIGLTTGAQQSVVPATIFEDHGALDFTPASGQALDGNGTNRQGSEPDPRQDFSLDIGENSRGTTDVAIGAYVIPSGAGSHALTATSVDATAEVGAPGVSQAHGLINTGLELATGAGAPAIAQVHEHSALSIEASSEVGSSALAETHGLEAGGLNSTVEVAEAALLQGNALTASGVALASLAGLSSLGQLHSLAPAGAQIDTNGSEPSVGQAHAFASADVTVPIVIGQAGLSVGAHALGATGVALDGQLSIPAMSQVQALTPGALAAEVASGTPALSVGTHDLAPLGLAVAVQATVPALAQRHAMAAVPVAVSISSDSPFLAEGVGLSGAALEVVVTIGDATVGQKHAVSASGSVIGVEVASPAVFQVHAFTAVDLRALVTAAIPALNGTVTAPPARRITSADGPSFGARRTACDGAPFARRLVDADGPSYSSRATIAASF